MTELRRINLDGQVVRMTLRGGYIAEISPDTGEATQTIIPLLIEPHVHLDKFDIATRARAMEPGLFGAIDATEADKKNWSEADLRERINRALGEVSRSGCRALRTHVDWDAEEVPIAWRVVAEVAEEWSDRVRVQQASLLRLEMLDDTDRATRIAARIANDHGVIGAFVYRNGREAERIAAAFELAEKFDLPLDFHVDEGLELEANAIEVIIAETARRGMGGRVLCGHACSLSQRGESEFNRIADAAASAGVAFTLQPSANLYLQDMAAGRTPRLRGIAPVHELRHAGVEVMLGTDNVRDPFVPFGALDPLQTLRLGWIAAHMRPSDWLNAVTAIPARLFSFEEYSIRTGAAADFILLPAGDINAALARPEITRTVWRKGRQMPQLQEV